MTTQHLWHGVILIMMSLTGMACNATAPPADDLPQPKMDWPAQDDASPQTVVFANGCFWCSEAVFEQLKGVTQVVSGYAGGTANHAHYDHVSQGATDHAEAIAITYDPAQITYAQLLRIFFTTHDPTTLNRQGPDHGRQYRSAVFFTDPQQQTVTQAYIDQLDAAQVFASPIVTTLEPLDTFYPAEVYHQDFVQKHPDHPYVKAQALPKVRKVQKRFADQLKNQPSD